MGRTVPCRGLAGQLFGPRAADQPNWPLECLSDLNAPAALIIYVFTTWANFGLFPSMSDGQPKCSGVADLFQVISNQYLWKPPVLKRNLL